VRFLHKVETAFVRLVGATDAQLVMRWDPEQVVTIPAPKITEHLVAIFGGDLALQKDNDNFNFYASQLRIRIKMAFGIMTRKWGILQRPWSIVLPQVKHLICAIARLHNFCIDEELKTVSASGHRRCFVHTRANLSPTQLAYMHASAQVRTRRICCVLTVSLLNLLRLNFIFVSIGSTPRDS
jgi:hypothetical protein